MYTIEKSINRLNNYGFTMFLDQKEVKEVTSHIKKNTYSIYKPFNDADKVILYSYKEPDISLIEIITKKELTHRDILGSLFSLQIESSTFGDIVITDNHYYFYILSNMKNYIFNELKRISNTNIELLEIDKNYLDNYERKYESFNIIVSSLRIDTIIARIIHSNRDTIKDLIKDKLIIYNYDILKDNSKTIKKGDIFSIRKYGKYKFIKIVKETKKNNLIIEINKYI